MESENSVDLGEERLARIREIVYEDSPRGFIWFYYLVAPSEWPLPKHCIEWIVKFYEARDEGKDLAVEAARGLLKSTIFSTYFPLYQLALNPTLEILVVMASDGLVKDKVGKAADTIDNSDGFRVLFPHIHPDKQQSWGEKSGYEIVDTRIPYPEFRRQRTDMPSLLGATYKAVNIQGRHPRLLGIFDDINNSKNSRHPREMQTVMLAVEQEIAPALDRVQMRIDVFTPWREGDVGDKAKKNPGTLHIKTPIYDPETLIPAWPEFKGEEWIEQEKKKHAPHIWGQMYLCDLSAGEGRILKREYLHYIPFDDIPDDLPVVIGCDYASVAKDQALKHRDYFAVAVLGIHPNGYLVLLDGVRKHVDRAEAEEILLNMGDKYKAEGRLLQVGIEMHGKGEEFADRMLERAKWRVKKLTSGNRSKGERFENQLVPIMAGARLRISERALPFIKQFEQEYLSWDGLDGTYYDDCLDAVYYATRLGAKFINWKDDSALFMSEPRQPVQSRNPLFKFARRRNAAA